MPEENCESHNGMQQLWASPSPLLAQNKQVQLTNVSQPMIRF